MAYKLIITQKAERDLDGIISYIVNELCNTPAAMRLLDEIEERYKLLAENPCIYGECQQPLLKAACYRKVVIRGFVLIYRVDVDKRTVIIERYFSDLEDYSHKL